MKPPSRPKASLRTIVEVAHAMMGGADLPECFVFGARGYYKTTMGQPDRNDRGIYDDALFVVGPGTFKSFNGNTDPSKYQPGIATLVPGVHWYRPGNHGISKPGGGYPAFRPATPGEALPVTRDGVTSISQGIAINIHRGGFNTTSSAGCQTIFPDQWSEFHRVLSLALAMAKQKRFPYILTDKQIS